MSQMSKQSWRALKDLSDPAAERTIIAGIIQHGADAFYEVDGTLNPNSFSVKENMVVFSAIKKLISEDKVERPDISTILTAIRTIDKDFVSKNNLTDYLTAVCSEKILKENIKTVGAIVSRLSFGRELIKRLESSIEGIRAISGEESMMQIASIAEDAVNSATDSLVSDEDIIDFSGVVSDYIDFFKSKKGQRLWISSGFPLYDKAIGGGFVCPGVHILGARTGVGKSFISVNVARNVSFLGIPVLYLDTELDPTFTMARYLAGVSGVPIDTITAGTFDSFEESRKIVHAQKQMEKAPFSYYNISGKHHKDWVGIIRKWVMKNVGFDDTGNLKPCLVILDYIKTMDLEHVGDFQEYQYLGQVSTDLHNFSIKYKLPIFALVQLNRDGIDREDQGVIAGSDRILALCSSFAILKMKSEQDVSADPKENGERKIVVLKSRYGTGTEFGEYINIKSNLAIGRMEEGVNNVEARKSRQNLITNAVKAKEGTRQKKEYAKANETEEEGIPL